jgi:AraC-like DNA-binding protein
MFVVLVDFGLRIEPLLSEILQNRGMSIQFSVTSFLALLIVINGLTISLVLWFFAKEKTRSNKFLSAVLLALTWTIAVGFLSETRLILFVPHFFRTGLIACLIAIPLTYLYVRSVVYRKGLETPDLIHALPLIIYLIDYFQLFILTTDKKIQLINNDLIGFREMFDFDEGWFTPPGFYYNLQYLLLFSYWLLQARILYLLMVRKNGIRRGYSLQSKVWLKYFVGLQLFGFIPFLFRPDNVQLEWVVIFISAGLPIIFITTWLFLNPEILYGLNVKRPYEKDALIQTDLQQNGAAHFSSPQEQELADALHKHMIEKRSFLQHKYTINHLSGDLNIPPHQISAFLNQQLNISFNDFLNKFRIEYCIERIKKGDAERYTLEALSSECGFSNRNSFTAAFKRLTGVTPSDYMKQLNSSN